MISAIFMVFPACQCSVEAVIAALVFALFGIHVNVSALDKEANVRAAVVRSVFVFILIL